MMRSGSYSPLCPPGERVQNPHISRCGCPRGTAETGLYGVPGGEVTAKRAERYATVTGVSPLPSLGEQRPELHRGPTLGRYQGAF
jgi:hypothetical protein